MRTFYNDIVIKGKLTLSSNGAGAAVNSLVITDDNTGPNALTYISIGTEGGVQGFIGGYGTAFNLPEFQNRIGISGPGAGIHYAASGGSADHLWSTGGSFTEKMRLNGVLLDVKVPITSTNTVKGIRTDASNLATNAGDGSLQALNTGGGAALIALHRASAFAAYLGLDTDNKLKFGGWSFGETAFTVWHSGIDGAGSGLDADTVDSIDSSQIWYGDNATRTRHMAGLNFNTYQPSGFYEYTPGALNAPTGDWQWVISHQHTNTGYGFQLSNPLGSSDLYMRGVSGGTPTAWVKFWNDANFNPNLKQNLNATLTTLVNNGWTNNGIPLGVGASGMTQTVLTPNTFIARNSTTNAGVKSITDGALAALANLTGKTAYTPTVVGTTVAGVGTYSEQVGFYVKFGPICFFKVRIAMSAHTGSGVTRITLPFAADNDAASGAAVVSLIDNFNTAANTQIMADILAGTNHIRILGLPLPGGGTSVTAGQALDTAFAVNVSGWYFTAP